MDDYYQLSSEMVMLQTTNSVFNTDLYSLITHESLLSWQRVRVANMMANSGQQWYDAVRRYNSGAFYYIHLYLLKSSKQEKNKKEQQKTLTKQTGICILAQVRPW